MTTLFRSRRAEDFAARVDGTGPVRLDSELDRLVGVVSTLRTHAEQRSADVAPRDEFVSDLRARLMTEAATVLTADNERLTLPPRTRTRERRLVAVASAAVLLGGTAGVATAAQNALPGDALYPIKRGIEKAEATMSTSSAGRGRDLLHQATDRLDEVHGLLAQSAVTGGTGATQVPGTLDAFTAQARDGADLMMDSYRDTRDPSTVKTLREFTADGLASLRSLSADAPEGTQSQLRDAARELQKIDDEAGQLCATCSDLPALTLPTSFLVSAEVQRALRKAEAGTPDNSHPVVAQRDAVRAAQKAAGSLAGSNGSGASTSSGTSTGSGSSTGTGSTVPDAPSTQAPAPSLPDATKPPKIKVKVDLDAPLDLGSGLGDAVETLLPQPDPDPTDLLP